jgi:hypothetical protein
MKIINVFFQDDSTKQNINKTTEELITDSGSNPVINNLDDRDSESVVSNDDSNSENDCMSDIQCSIQCQ